MKSNTAKDAMGGEMAGEARGKTGIADNQNAAKKIQAGTPGAAGTIFIDVPVEALAVADTLKAAGFEAYLIGGCTRDALIGREAKDWDFTTNAKPDQIIALFPKTFYENEYGTVGVVFEESTNPAAKIIEVTPFREEGEYTDKRRPDKLFSVTISKAI